MLLGTKIEMREGEKEGGSSDSPDEIILKILLNEWRTLLLFIGTLFHFTEAWSIKCITSRLSAWPDRSSAF